MCYMFSETTVAFTVFVLLGNVVTVWWVEELRIYAPYIFACNSEGIFKNGAELPKLTKK